MNRDHLWLFKIGENIIYRLHCVVKNKEVESFESWLKNLIDNELPDKKYVDDIGYETNYTNQKLVAGAISRKKIKDSDEVIFVFDIEFKRMEHYKYFKDNLSNKIDDVIYNLNIETKNACQFPSCRISTSSYFLSLFPEGKYDVIASFGNLTVIEPEIKTRFNGMKYS
jgi:hypothetical protein